MAINQNRFIHGWVRQGTKPNCGSCCMASIINYANLKLNEAQNPTRNAALVRQGVPNVMNDDAYVGLLVGNVHNLGSVTSRLAQWLTGQYPTRFHVTEVKVQGKRQHWGGIINSALLTGGASHRPTVVPDAAYFNHPDRFLLRECSVHLVAGHYIIQTDADEFWDPNRHAAPLDLASVKSHYSWVGEVSGLSMRADACQIDVV